MLASVERLHDRFGGQIVQRLGDGTLSMFSSSLAAAQAAVEIQRDLTQAGVPARIGIHIGDVIVERERLTGDAVNVASRIESFAVPGAVILSDAARDQIKNQGDVATVSLGRFRLKNVGRPFELFAVSATGSWCRTTRSWRARANASRACPATSRSRHFPGRQGYRRGFARRAGPRTTGSLTITGPGGVGKTRIVIEVGRVLAPEFLDGVSFVPLADVTEAEDFVPALAAALDVKEAEGTNARRGHPLAHW